MSLCNTTSYEVQTFKGNDPPFKRSIAIQSFWNMDEMKRVKETSPFARVAKSNEHPKLQSTNTINLKKVSRPFCEYQQISTVNFLFSAPLRWTRPHVVATGRSPVAEAITNPFRFSAMAGVRPLHHLQGERPWHSPRRPSLFRSPSRWHGSDDIYIVICGKSIDHNWNWRLEVLREKPWSVLRVFAQQAAQSRCALLQCGGNMHKKNTNITNITSYKCDESSQWPALQPLQPPGLPFSWQA